MPPRAHRRRVTAYGSALSLFLLLITQACAAFSSDASRRDQANDESVGLKWSSQQQEQEYEYKDAEPRAQKVSSELGKLTQLRQANGVPRVGRRRWHLLNISECTTFRARLRAAEASSILRPGSASKLWQPGEYRRQPQRCWSHAEWFCFAGVPKKSRPSQRLLRLLDLYRARVRECGVLDGPRDWAGLREAMRSGRPAACRYMLWSPTKDGLGNQMLSLASAFVYSLLTFRVLLIEPASSSISDLFCEPFFNTPSWLFRHAHEFGGKKGVTSGPFVTNYTYFLNPPFQLDRPVPNVLPFHVHLWSDMQPFFCPETHRWAENATALVISSNLYWVPAIYYVPYFRRKLEALFPSRRTFAAVAPLILHPSNRVWAQVTSFLLQDGDTADGSTAYGDWDRPASALRSPPTPIRVGLQFRANFGIPVAEAVDGSIACLKALPKLLHHRSLWPNFLVSQGQSGGDCPGSGSSLEAGGGSETTSRLTVLLASLDEAFKSGVLTQLEGEGGSSWSGKGQVSSEIKVISLTSDTGQEFGNLEHNERALVEILSLAFSSDIVLLTPRSTFGYTIAGLSSAVPLFLTSCEPAMPEPCFLRPEPHVQCRYSRFKVEGGAIPGVSDPYLRSCPDAEWLHQHWEKQVTTGVVAIDKDVTS